MVGIAAVSRRSFLIGCSAAASPLWTPVSFAAAPGENRLVVIVLRGGIDGLDLVRPLGDPAYAALRPTLAADAAVGPALDGFYALHPGAAGLLPLWQAGELGFVHATCTPYRDRSHFIGQDALENGTADGDGAPPPDRDGWLNRAIARIPGAGPSFGVSVGRGPMLILEGAARTAAWMPVAQNDLSSQAQALLAVLYQDDPEFAPVFDGATALMDETGMMRVSGRDDSGKVLGGYVANRLKDDARIASFSLGGWDTHQQQAKFLGDRLGGLADAVLAIRQGLGRHWGTTLVLAMTEFGGTAAENGSGGTDHGTGGVVILAGGALRGGTVRGTWPGLAEADLLDRRDLMPTSDARAWAGWALRDLFGLPASAIAGGVFPALDMGGDPGLLR